MPVNYDSKGRVLKPNTQHEWTNDMVTEYARCARSVKYFATHHCKVVTVLGGIVPLELREYQMNILTMIDNNQRNVINQGRQSGKCVYCDTVAKFRNKITGEIVEVTLKDFFNNYL
jgi:hypothetical protein